MELLTNRGIVADGIVVGHEVVVDIANTTGAVLRVAANALGGLPHHLREVAPIVEQSHVWRVLTEAGEIHHLIVVELLRDDTTDVVGIRTGSDVLAIPSTIDVPVQL